MRTYNDVRDGDLLIWREDRLSRTSNFFLGVVRLATVSDFAHVGVAMWLNGKLHVVEATQPYIRVSQVTDMPYHIPMPGAWTEESSSFLIAQVGTDYGFMDCVRAYLGITTARDDNWQCAELTHEFYRLGGYDLGSRKTPSRLVRKALRLQHANLALVCPPLSEFVDG